MNLLYPFSAIIGQENAKKALLCALVSEDIRSVLIMGTSGTAKSTLARSIVTLVDDKKMLTIPQNITFDRLLGMIDLEKAVATGTIQMTPGILKQGNSQILYADNLNLMDEGIVKNILSTSEQGYFILEREGFSHLITTRFTFIATMDPAEGELSAGQLDLFDLCVRVDPIDDKDIRSDIIRRHLQFENTTDEFIREYE